MSLAKNPTQFLNEEAHFLIDGPAGDLELLTLASRTPAKGVAIICHPHPLYQGTMHNKVVHTLSRAFHHQGLHAVRFNFRGVGKSTGQFGDSIGEIADLMAVLSWVDKVLAQPKIYLAGFSFGAYIAAQGAVSHTCQQLFTIAPAVNHQDYAQLPEISCPWVVVQGEADDVISPELVYDWFEKHQQTQKNMTLLTIPEASHFFHGDLVVLRNLIETAFVANLQQKLGAQYASIQSSEDNST